MLTAAEIKEKLEDRNLRVVAERTGVHYQTLWRIARKGCNPSLATAEKLSAYFMT